MAYWSSARSIIHCSDSQSNFAVVLSHLIAEPILRVYRQYSFQFIPILGKILAGDSESYQYLVESIERFPSQSEFAQL